MLMDFMLDSPFAQPWFLAAPPGDFNHDGIVDAADYVLWRKTPADFGGDPDGYNTWRANFGASAGSGAGALAGSVVPEPAGLVLLLLAGAIGMTARRLRRTATRRDNSLR